MQDRTGRGEEGKGKGQAAARPEALGAICPNAPASLSSCPHTHTHTEAKIKELIGVLDMRKNEAIERTFKGVAKNFRYCQQCDEHTVHCSSTWVAH